MKDEAKSGRTVATLDTTYRILETLININGGTVTEVANTAGLAKSTVHAHLNTLCTYDFVVREGQEYNIGLRFLDYGLYARNQIEGFSLIRKKAAALAEQSGELVVFIVEESRECYATARLLIGSQITSGRQIGFSRSLTGS